jgi:aspartate-semialdehyde dehydrogenase
VIGRKYTPERSAGAVFLQRALECHRSMAVGVAIVGATGLVGRTLLRLLHERRFPVRELRLFASERSAGTVLEWCGERLRVERFAPERLRGLELSLWSAGAELSRQYAWEVARRDCLVVDNSSAWRAHPEVPLVVPEVNPEALQQHRGVIANPNCVVIPLTMLLKPILERWGIRRVVVATYQSISGAGQRGIEQLQAELRGEEPPARVAPWGIAFTTAFHRLDAEGWSEEERKVVAETRRILGQPQLPITATCVRLPTLGAHAEAVWVETEQQPELEMLRRHLGQQPGMVVLDEPAAQRYPHPAQVRGSDSVYIGRLRRDDSVPAGIIGWIVADNIRKGAATNAVQIAELLLFGGH